MTVATVPEIVGVDRPEGRGGVVSTGTIVCPAKLRVSNKQVWVEWEVPLKRMQPHKRRITRHGVGVVVRNPGLLTYAQ